MTLRPDDHMTVEEARRQGILPSATSARTPPDQVGNRQYRGLPRHSAGMPSSRCCRRPWIETILARFEFKASDGSRTRQQRLSGSQRDHRAWCGHHSIRHTVCTSVNEAWRTLIEWGAVVS